MVTTTADVTGGVSIAGAAPLSFVHGSVQVANDLTFEWDFDNDGDYDQTVEDFTDYVLSGDSLAGRDQPSAIAGRSTAGRLRLLVVNEDNRFSAYNTSSPLGTAPFSLKPGRRIRVRTDTSTPDDPVLLARDRFQRPDGALGSAETGQAWTNRQGAFTISGQVAAPSTDYGIDIMSTVNVGVNNYYGQVTLRKVPPGLNYRNVGLVVRWTDNSNYCIVYYDTSTNTIRITDVVATIGTDIGVDYDLSGWEGMTLGASVVGSTVTAYVGGVAVVTGTVSTAASSNIGLFTLYPEFTGAAPRIGDFAVWDHVAAEIEGILWTGTVTKVQPNVTVGGLKTATIDAEGILTTAARADIASPRLTVGAATGLIVGDIFSRAGLLNPPARMDEGTVATGPVGIDDGKALSLAREVEETERGFIYETNEGQLAFMDAASRASETPQAWFGDYDGAQFQPQSVELIDRTTFIVNQVTAGVAPDTPSGISHTIVAGTGNVDIVTPTVAAHDLLVYFVASTTNTVGERWLNPIFWQSHRDTGTALGMHVYSHWCDGTETGSTVIFYANGGAAAGLWVAALYRIQGWFQSPAGLAIGDVTNGNDPGALVHGWGRDPTLFIACATAIASATHIVYDVNFDVPDGYGTPDGTITSSGSGATEAGIVVATKVDITESEDPTSFNGLTGGLLNESVVFAVRGFNGEHTKATLDNPNTIGGSGRFVTVDDLDSQDEHNAIIPYRDAATLLATEAAADAYGDAVLAAAANPLPSIEMSFLPITNAAYRAQAYRRRVGDKIHLTANTSSGLGIDGDFFIEAIAHAWSDGGLAWRTTWELSPA